MNMYEDHLQSAALRSKIRDPYESYLWDKQHPDLFLRMVRNDVNHLIRRGLW